eukprot:1034417-Karenia_brevis.AAC.1
MRSETWNDYCCDHRVSDAVTKNAEDWSHWSQWSQWTHWSHWLHGKCRSESPKLNQSLSEENEKAQLNIPNEANVNQLE